MHPTFWLEILNGRDHSDGLGIDAKPVDVKEIGYEDNDLLLIGPGLCPVATSCEHDNGRLGFIKGGKILDHPSDCNFLRKNSASWLTVQS
jgi:hypothetical protein